MIDDYMKRKTTNSGQSPFFFGESMRYQIGNSSIMKDKDLNRFVEKQ